MTELREMKPGVRSGMMAGSAARRRRQRAERPPVEIVASDGTIEGDLRAARSEEAAARRAWNVAVERDQALLRPLDVSAADAERLGITSVYRLDNLKRRNVDPVELEIARARTARDREDAALALAAARDELAPLALAAANIELHEAAEAYAPTAASLDRERDALERDFAALIVRSWRVSGLLLDERQAWARVAEAAKSAALSPEVRDQIEADGVEELPSAMTAIGPLRTISRAQRRLFGGLKPASESTFLALARAALAGPQQGRDLGGRRLAAALDEAQQRIINDDTR